MIFYLQTKLQQKNNLTYLQTNNQIIFLDDCFIDSSEQCEGCYLYFLTELNHKNLLNHFVFAFASIEQIMVFKELLNISGFGINSVAKIFRIGKNNFLDDLKNLTSTEFIAKYQINQKQWLSLKQKYFVIKRQEIHPEWQKRLINLGYNKAIVNKIFNLYAEQFNNLEFSDVIRKFVELNKNEF